MNEERSAEEWAEQADAVRRLTKERGLTPELMLGAGIEALELLDMEGFAAAARAQRESGDRGVVLLGQRGRHYLVARVNALPNAFPPGG